MTGDKVKEVCTTYRNLLRREVHPEDSTWRQPHVERLVDEGQRLRQGRHVERNHVLWMIDEIDRMVDAGRLEKAFRWLGFVQGWLWATERRTIDVLRRDNMPAGEALQR